MKTWGAEVSSFLTTVESKCDTYSCNSTPYEQRLSLSAKRLAAWPLGRIGVRKCEEGGGFAHIL